MQRQNVKKFKKLGKKYVYKHIKRGYNYQCKVKNFQRRSNQMINVCGLTTVMLNTTLYFTNSTYRKWFA